MMHDNKNKKIKCVVWDLDNTIWDGVLAENDNIKIKPNIYEIIEELDNRGIIQSIASKNNSDDAMEKLKEFNIQEYFLYPQINWNIKSESIKKISQELNIGIDSIIFIDDQDFELEEVKSCHKNIVTLNSIEYKSLLEHSGLIPKYITKDSKRRRQMYIEDIKRKNEEENYIGPKESFLKSLEMKLIVSEAKQDDLERVEELTLRTNQLNTTGKTYGYDELNRFIESDNYKVFICELEDKYGTYGKIGISLIEVNDESWMMKLFLTSCRVMSRGVGSIFLTYILKLAKLENKRFFADFKITDRNKLMYLTYKFLNFKEIDRDDSENIVFEKQLVDDLIIPDYVNIIKEE